MDFTFAPEQREIREAIFRICARFGDDYWLKKDKDGGFPHDFHQALAADGWLGIAMPEAYGGSGLGVTEAALMMQATHWRERSSGSRLSGRGGRGLARGHRDADLDRQLRRRSRRA